MRNVVRYTKFKSNPFGDGGSKRSAQIEEIWRKDGVCFVEEDFLLPKHYSIWTAINWMIRSFIFISKNVGWRKYRGIKEKFDALLTFALRIPIAYDKYKGKKVTFLWEHTNDYSFLYLMKAAGAEILAYPHNLESLVPEQEDPQTKKKSPYWLYEEIGRYKLCDKVFCISKEETWLLQIFGIYAEHLPYYPSEEALVANNCIRAEREERHNGIQIKKYLIIGSATNQPTLAGMNELLRYFDAKNNYDFELHVGGHNTEELVDTTNNHIIKHGTLTNQNLKELLTTIDGLIIYQPTTSGALTRIVEFRLMGIPVYANFGAARNYYNLPDVHVYGSLDELYSFLINL